ncbi:hypothetical protein HRQ91_10110 [Treponema parvum]|uniref:Tetratricopeptide repeat protein n=1 Tax=Treponema parvum TaxID=138851 RepID=A0A975IFC8_9SPIR|nr:hypothetical protein [Treponema parvum]QTQ14788.1 hypothetical protein HRQ91_10110 [Treponema parvum]
MKKRKFSLDLGSRTVFAKSFLYVFGILLLFLSCSSAPKRPARIVTQRNLAVQQLDIANTESERGNYVLASTLMDEAWKLAVGVDAADLRIKALLSMGNLAFYKKDAASAENYWHRALDEAAAENEENLVSAAKIYLCRGLLSYGNGDSSKDRAKETIDIVSKEMGKLKKSDELYEAYAWRLIGFSYKELSDWNSAEKAFRNSLEIHEKLIYLEMAAYDWYAIASVRSVAKNYDGALSAADSAISFDRRAENSYGLGMDYMAKGDIYMKTGNIEKALLSYSRAKDIFSSAALYDEAKVALKRAEGIQSSDNNMN